VLSSYEEGLEIFIELVPQGELTPHPYKLQLGDTILCRKIAKGRFTLDVKSGRSEHFYSPRSPESPRLSATCAQCTRIGKAGQRLARQP
jgi:hypothetical protein